MGNHLWQSTLFGLFIVLIVIFLKKGDAGTRYIIGWVGLIKFVLPSSFLFLFFINHKPAPYYENVIELESTSSSNVNLAEPFILINQPGTFFEEAVTVKRSVPPIGLSTLDVLGIIWLSVALLIFARWQYVLCRFIGEIKFNSQPFTDSLNLKMTQLRDRIGLSKKVSGYLINKNIEPGSFGVFSPKLIIPSALIQELTQKELELVLLHELIHIKRRDNLWSFLQKVFFCILWFNPLIWWLNRRLMWESEKMCDEGVLKFSEGHSTYTKCILKVTRYCIGRKIVGYSGMSDIDLESRMENIIEFNRHRFSRETLRRFLIVSVVFFLVLTTAASGFMTHRIKPSARNFEAYNQYFLGRSHWMKRAVWILENEQNEERLRAAVKHFEQAITLNPKQALAYAGLADVYLNSPSRMLGITFNEKKAHAEKAANMAMVLNPNLAEARASIGQVKQYYYKDYKGAEREYQRAIELNSRYASAHNRYADLLFYQFGRLDEALVASRKTVELEPSSPYYNRHLGSMLTFSHKYDAAIQQYQRTIELEPNYPDVWVWMGLTFDYLNEFEDSLTAKMRWTELVDGDKEMQLFYVSLLEEHARTGKPVTPPPELVKYFEKWGWTVFLYAYLGHKEKTMELLEAQNQSYGFMKYYPAYDFLHSEPRFIELLQRAKTSTASGS